MRRVFITILLFACILANATEDTVTMLTTQGVTSVANILAKADVAIGKTKFFGTNALKGSFGESIVEKDIINQMLNRNNKRFFWESISPRLASQGIDHISLRLDSKNKFLPTGNSVMIGETKWNSSELKPVENKTDVQMSDEWCRKRLKIVSIAYEKITKINKDNIEIRPKGFFPKNELDVFLSNEKKVSFWSNDGEKWYFDGAKGDLNDALERAKTYANLFENASNGGISIRKRLFHVIPEGNDIKVFVKDATNVGKIVDGKMINKTKHLPTTHEVILKGALGKVPSGNWKNEAIASLKKAFPEFSEKDMKKLVNEIVDEAKTVHDLLKKMPKYHFAKHVIKTNLYAASAALAIDVMVSGGFEKKQIVTVASAIGGTTIALNTWRLGNNKMLNAMGLASKKSLMRVSGGSGMLGASAIYAYGNYFMGNSSLETANREMFVGVVSTVVAEAVKTGVLLAISEFGTASTGVAISSLKGAAATNAALAWLAGGAKAVGGGGVAMGSCVLVGGTLVVAIVAATTIYLIYEKVDDNKRKELRKMMVEILSDENNLDNLISQYSVSV